MEKNIGKNERAIRVIIGFVLFFIGAMGSFFDLLLVLMMLIGIVLMATGALGNCPLYSLLKKGQTAPETSQRTR